MNEVFPFHFESKPVRVIMSKLDEPWFVAADICRILDLENVTVALRVLDPDEKHTLNSTQGIAQITDKTTVQSINIISEPGLYKLLMRSRKPEAKRFDRWVRHDVLPSIRKTGSYAAPAPVDLENAAALRGLLLTYTEKVMALQESVAVMQPKVEALDRIETASGGSMIITGAAKVLQVKPNTLFSLLREKRWVYPGDGGFLAYQEKIDAGLVEHKVTVLPRADGKDKCVKQVRITPRGLAKLATMIPQPIQAQASLQV